MTTSNQAIQAREKGALAPQNKKQKNAGTDTATIYVTSVLRSEQ